MKSFILISLIEGSGKNTMEELKAYPEVSRAYFLFGEWDILLEVDLTSSEQLGTFIINELRSREDIKLTSSLIVASN